MGTKACQVCYEGNTLPGLICQQHHDEALAALKERLKLAEATIEVARNYRHRSVDLRAALDAFDAVPGDVGPRSDPSWFTDNEMSPSHQPRVDANVHGLGPDEAIGPNQHYVGPDPLPDTRLGLKHRWEVGDGIADFENHRTLTVTAIVDHGGDHFVAVFLPKWEVT